MGEKNKAQTNKSNVHFRILWSVKEKKNEAQRRKNKYGQQNVRVASFG